MIVERDEVWLPMVHLEVVPRPTLLALVPIPLQSEQLGCGPVFPPASSRPVLATRNPCAIPTEKDRGGSVPARPRTHMAVATILCFLDLAEPLPEHAGTMRTLDMDPSRLLEAVPRAMPVERPFRVARERDPADLALNRRAMERLATRMTAKRLPPHMRRRPDQNGLAMRARHFHSISPVTPCVLRAASTFSCISRRQGSRLFANPDPYTH